MIFPVSYLPTQPSGHRFPGSTQVLLPTATPLFRVVAALVVALLALTTQVRAQSLPAGEGAYRPRTGRGYEPDNGFAVIVCAESGFERNERSHSDGDSLFGRDCSVFSRVAHHKRLPNRHTSVFYEHHATDGSNYA